MAITREEVFELMRKFHDVVMLDKGSAADQAAFFLLPEPMIFIPHGEDITLQSNCEIHQRLADEVLAPMEQLDVIQLSSQPERARAIGAVYRQGRLATSPTEALIKCIVGEDW